MVTGDRDQSEPGVVGLAEIKRAQEVIEGLAVRTPMEESRWLSAIVGGPVRLKCENLQRTGSFKARGAFVRISGLGHDERARGVVAASAGNHAQGVALAAQVLGIHATVYMPHGAPIPKERATRGYGAQVVFEGSNLEEALAAAHRHAEETGAILIHPFDHPDVVAGQGTVGLEILEQSPQTRTVIVPAGGGGLLGGIALAIKKTNPATRVVGVQAAGAAAYPASLEHGQPVALETMSTMADGIAVGMPGDLTFAAVRDHVDEILTVSEESMSQALLALVERAKMVVEPSGAAAVAAMMDRPDAFETPAVAVLSGGNVDPLLLAKVIRHGMAAGGRYLGLRVTIPDAPGGLAQLLTDLSTTGANVVEIVHDRFEATLHVNEVEVALQLETRGGPHAQEVHRALLERGYRVRGAG